MQDFSTNDLEQADQIASLIQKHLNGVKLSNHEFLVLENWKSISRENSVLFERFQNPSLLKENLIKWHEIQKNSAANKIRGLKMVEEPKASNLSSIGIPPAHRVHFLWRGFSKYVAAVIIILGIGAYLWNAQQKEKPNLRKTYSKADVAAPENNRATLILADGKKVFLDSAGSGVLAVQGDINIEKTDDGNIIYQGSAIGAEMQHNILNVPRGSQIANLVLSDGSKVSLNAGSSLKYPVAFNNVERRVEITGEAYFEVAKDAKRKFIVMGGGVRTEVLGTEFNVNAYPDEMETKITLVKGRVKVSAHTEKVIIEPGEQAELTNQKQLTVNKKADVLEAIAWKKGVFVFSNADLHSILRQVSRWYNVEIVYKAEVPAGSFGGTLSRLSPLSDLVGILESNGVNCLIEGNKLIIGK
jgi:transmembrane sensor